jgi:hypothetical protein
MYLDSFAEVFAAAGLNALVFDNRCFGASAGEPRQEIDPWAQVRDYRNAITYAITLPEVDSGRIGIWGSSYSGGHVLVVAAIDRRVKAVVCQVPLISGHDNLRALVRADFIAGFREMFDADRLARFNGEPPVMVPVVDKDPLAPSALPTADSWEWFSETGNTRAPAWRNEVTLRSVEMFTEYEPGVYLPWISPTPLLMLVAAGDHLVRYRGLRHGTPAQGTGDPAGRSFRRLHQGVRRRQRAGAGLVRPAPGLGCHGFRTPPGGRARASCGAAGDPGQRDGGRAGRRRHLRTGPARPGRHHPR